MKNVVILGSAGSIGENTLRVVEALPSDFRIVGLAVNRNYVRALEQAEKFGVAHIAVADPEAAARCRQDAPTGVHIHPGEQGVEALAALEGADVAVCAVVGMAGLKPVLAALKSGVDVALATKEVLVVGGHIVTKTCREQGTRILPIDSEQSAIFQCLAGTGRVSGMGCVGDGEAGKAPVIKRLILTASGGPFAFREDIDFDKATVEEALAHPNWDMGKKVTVDSATLMNKGLEIMEARWLFDVPVERIDVLVHTESIIHSMVEFTDGSILAQLSLPDMRFAIQYALTYPDRLDGDLPALNLADIGSLNFRRPDTERFPCLGLAREAAARGGTLPAVLNAANEVAVERFLQGKISFSGIWHLVQSVMEKHATGEDPGMDEVLAADEWSRRVSEEVCSGMAT